MKKKISRVKKNFSKARSDFKKEFNKHLLTAISAAFGFLIALSWREPISDALNLLLEPLGARQTIILKFIGALIITLLAALVILFLTKYLKEKDKD